MASPGRHRAPKQDIPINPTPPRPSFEAKVPAQKPALPIGVEPVREVTLEISLMFTNPEYRETFRVQIPEGEEGLRMLPDVIRDYLQRNHPALVGKPYYLAYAYGQVVKPPHRRGFTRHHM